jgi:hypothetical protein
MGRASLERDRLRTPRPRLPRAACKGARTDAFFAESGPLVFAAKKLCERCPEMVLCRTWGLAFEEFGIWGGLTAKERNLLRRDRASFAVGPGLVEDGDDARRESAGPRPTGLRSSAT